MVAAVAVLVPLTVGFAPRLRIPAVVLEIIGGIVIGPSGFGWVRADLPVQILALFGLAFLLTGQRWPAADGSGTGQLSSIVVMVPADPEAGPASAAAPRLDPDSAEWLRALAGTGPQREVALARLHGMLVRIARAEAGRRAPRLRLAGPSSTTWPTRRQPTR